MTNPPCSHLFRDAVETCKLLFCYFVANLGLLNERAMQKVDTSSANL